MKNLKFVCLMLMIISVLAGCDEADKPVKLVSATPSTPPASIIMPPPQYVGASACSSCHAQQAADWHGSHHDLAMQTADTHTVLGDFNQATFRYNGIVTTFYREQDRFRVRTDGADGKLHDYTIKYTFGVTPLQQYLIEFEDGRVQALGIAWDSRPKAEGGQRWFHLYPDQQVDFRNPLHWTARDQNWNYMCAECHTTDLHKNYDFTSDSYHTTFREINVACEACHGPGSNHVDWAQGTAAWATRGASQKGLAIQFDERSDVHWRIDSETGNATRSKPRLTNKEITTCARCHSRRSVLSEQFVHGRPLGDTHRLALLDEVLYFPDGQPADENYVYGSFLQSKMAAKGVTCSDCHQPHSLALKLPGDQVCSQCHQAERYAGPQHHFHPQESAGARCAECHMPVKNFMVVDGRHDHSFRIPRPDLSVKLGTPNVCTGCHQNKTDQWAADQMQQWYDHSPQGFQHYAEILQGARQGDPAAHSDLQKLATDPAQPTIARATALTLLPAYDGSLATLSQALSATDPLLRRAAVEALANLPPDVRLKYLPPLLTDNVLEVRLAAVVALANIDPAQVTAPLKDPLQRALTEYVAAQQLNADRPEAWVNLCSLYLQMRDVAQAQQACQSALRLDPDYVPALVNLADLYRVSGQEDKGETLLQEGISRQPEAAALHHAMGLLRVRQQRYEASLVELARASELAPDDSRFAYVYAVALYNSGQTEKAMLTLESILQHSPFERDSLIALVSYAQETGDQARLQQYASRLQALTTGQH